MFKCTKDLFGRFLEWSFQRTANNQWKKRNK